MSTLRRSTRKAASSSNPAPGITSSASPADSPTQTAPKKRPSVRSTPHKPTEVPSSPLSHMTLEKSDKSSGSNSSRPATPLSIRSSTPTSLMGSVDADMTSLLIPGTRLLVQKTIDGMTEWRKAEIMAIRSHCPTETMSDPGILATSQQYYVHFVDFNKRLDEWVTMDRLDISTAELASGRLTTPLSSASATPTFSTTAGHKRPVKTVVMNEMENEIPSKEQEIEQLRRGGSMTRRIEEVSRVKNFDCIELGKYLVDTWYFSPYPPQSINPETSTVYLCEFCLAFFASRHQLGRHRSTQRCQLTHPPGLEIYRKDHLSFWELDGHKQKRWCRNLCLLSKLFLDHKTLFYDVDPFMLYVLTENDQRGSHLIGYFSKEKDSTEGYNLACILTLPQHQRKGYGRLLIEMSYELSKRQGKVGSPEKPLSDLGLLGYRSFWAEQIVRLLKQAHEDRRSLSVDTLSTLTGFTKDDVVHTLQAIGALRYQRGNYIIVLTPKIVQDHEQQLKKCKLALDPSCLHWTPPQFTAADLRFL